MARIRDRATHLGESREAQVPEFQQLQVRWRKELLVILATHFGYKDVNPIRISAGRNTLEYRTAEEQLAHVVKLADTVESHVERAMRCSGAD